MRLQLAQCKVTACQDWRTLAYHDALEFPDAQIVLLTSLYEGQEATVLQLPVQSATAAEAKAQERVVHVG